jgi:hypothetical protein
MAAQRRTAVALLLLSAAWGVAGCATQRGGGPSGAGPAERFATALEASDPAVDAAIAQMDAFERRAAREESAVAFALGRGGTARAGVAAPAAAPGAAEAAGDVLAPAFTALGDYADALQQAAAGGVVAPRPSPGGPVLAQAAAQGLGAVRATVPPATRDAGLAAIANLPAVASGAAGRRVAPAALAQGAQPHLAATAALLRAVIGADPGAGTRGAVGARRSALDAAHARLLDAAAADRSMGAGGRYALYQSLAAMRDEDPIPEAFDAILALLAAMEEAHAAVASAAPDAEGKVAAFESAMAGLIALSGDGDEN